MRDLIVIDPLLEQDESRRMLKLRRAFGSYACVWAHRGEDRSTLGSRIKYFRESYVYGSTVSLPGIEILLNHEGLAAAARELHGREVIVPRIVYANILVPGQKLEVHTDLPEYRGADRRSAPQRLLLVMQHSGLFERWRLPIATAITYFGGGRGGVFVYYPDGPTGVPAAHQPRHNTAVVLDADTVFHGVEPVVGDHAPLGSFPPGIQIHADSGNRWTVQSADGSRVLATYHEDELRYSVSWKSYCFADESERAQWADHTDDLSIDRIMERLVADLRARDRLSATDPVPPDEDLRRLLEDTYGGTSWRDTEIARSR